MVFDDIGYRNLDAGDRKGIIGGSQVGAILGLDGYVKPYDVYAAYMGITPPPDPQTQWNFDLGHIMEEPIAKMFTKRTGISLVEVPQALYDRRHPYLVLHPDRAFAEETDGMRFAVECKNSSSHSHWPEPVEMDNPFPWLDVDVLYDGSSLPGQYRAQCLWYTAFGYDGVFLSRYTDTRLYIYYVPSNVRYEKALRDAAISWREDVESGWTPPASSTRSLGAIYATAAEDSSMDATLSMEELCRSIGDKEDEKADTELELESLRAELMAGMKDVETLRGHDGKVLATWKGERRTTFDAARFRKDHPELYRRYVTTTCTRVLRVR